MGVLFVADVCWGCGFGFLRLLQIKKGGYKKNHN